MNKWQKEGCFTTSVPVDPKSSDACFLTRMNYPAAELRGIKRNFHLTPMQSIEEFF